MAVRGHVRSKTEGCKPPFCKFGLAQRSNESGTGTQLDSVSDHVGNWYRVVEINGQCWLAENMRCTTSPRQGTVNLQSGGTSGTNYDNPMYYDYNSTVSTSYPQVVTNLRARGFLYNWVAAMDTMYTSTTRPSTVNFPNRRGICPEGWHLPTDDEWFMLEKNVLTNASWASVTSASDYGTEYRGTGAGKLTGGCVWSSSTKATAPGNYSYADRNNTGFSALPVGNYHGSFYISGIGAGFWSATSYSTNYAWSRSFNRDSEGVYRTNSNKYNGCSVRCLRD